MDRIEVVLFASSSLVDRSANICWLKISNPTLNASPMKLFQWVTQCLRGMFRTRSQYAAAIQVSASLGDQQQNFTKEEIAVFCAVAYHQPIDRAGLKDIFGKEINRDLLARLRCKKLISNGPKSSRPVAPHTFVTSVEFLATFDLQNLQELPELD